MITAHLRLRSFDAHLIIDGRMICGCTAVAELAVAAKLALGGLLPVLHERRYDGQQIESALSAVALGAIHLEIRVIGGREVHGPGHQYLTTSPMVVRHA